MRRDALEHRRRILSAADEVFGEKGFRAPLEDIIRRADVGRATLYRNFDNRLSLWFGVVDHNIDGFQTAIQRLDGGDDDFTRLLDLMVDLVARLAIAEPTVVGDPRHAAALRRIADLWREPLERARSEGSVRSDLSAEDMDDMLGMLNGALSNRPLADRLRRAPRLAELLTDGIAAAGHALADSHG